MHSGVTYCTNTIRTRYTNMVTSGMLTLWQNGLKCTIPPVEKVHHFSLVFTALFGDNDARTVELGFNVTERAWIVCVVINGCCYHRGA